MSDLPSLLLASLAPATRKQAEQNLATISAQPGFLLHLLQLVLDAKQDRSVRLAGGVYFKNSTKRRWAEDTDEPKISNEDKAVLRAQLVPAMIALSSPTDKALRAQVAESVSVVAENDFPRIWTDLIDQLVSSLSPSDYTVNLGVLETAHSIFGRWRSQIRSDELYSTINYVLERFMPTYLEVFRATSNLVLSNTPPPNLPLLAQTQFTLVQLFYDLTAQDLPPALEDLNDEFFGTGTDGKPLGWFLKFLAWGPPSLQGEPEDTTPSIPAQIQTGILEICELYAHRYAELFSTTATVSAFVRAVWNIVGGGKNTNVGADGLVAQSMRFLSTTIRSGQHKDIFGSKETISGLVEGVVVPNVQLRDHETEQFEDDPLEYIRLDLALPTTTAGTASFSTSGGGDGTTRRHAAADVLRALVSSGWEAEATEIVGAWISKGLQDYNSNPSENWKSKNSAIFLLTAIASRGSTAQHGVTSTNTLIDVVKFFSDHIAQDLQADLGSVHPILQVDAIRFLHTFRNQLTKEQLLSVLPLLVRHLGSSNYVCYSYAAITIERILFMKQGNAPLFSPSDISAFANDILTALFAKIESGGTPEKVAENDYLMKCVMRVIITSRQSLAPAHEGILGRIVGILGVISKNPSNPNFTQYCFESIAALLRFTVAANPSTLATFEGAIFPPFTFILQQDIDQFIPYVFQILSQMLELHTQDVPTAYRSLLPLLLTPEVWAQRGSVPGLVRLVKAYLARDSQQMVASGQVSTVLAIVQQRLLPSKVNEDWGFDLLQAVFVNVPVSELQKFIGPVLILLMTKLQNNKTDKYTSSFVHFIFFVMAVQVDGLGPDFVIRAVDGIQPGLWSNILRDVVLPALTKIPQRDRKVVVVGMTRLLTQSELMLSGNNVQNWPATFTGLVKVFTTQDLRTVAEDPDAILTAIDFEEQNAGYQAAYSRLASSEAPRIDHVAYVADPKEFLRTELLAAQGRTGGKIKELVGQSDATVVVPFAQTFPGGLLP